MKKALKKLTPSQIAHKAWATKRAKKKASQKTPEKKEVQKNIVKEIPINVELRLSAKLFKRRFESLEQEKNTFMKHFNAKVEALKSEMKEHEVFLKQELFTLQSL